MRACLTDQLQGAEFFWTSLYFLSQLRYSRISRNPNVLYRLHKILPHSKLEESSPFLLILFFVIHFNIIIPSTLYFPIRFLSSDFPTNTLYAFLFSPKRRLFPAHMNLLHLNTLIIFGGKQCSRSSSYDILHPAVLLKIKNFIWGTQLLEIGNNQAEKYFGGHNPYDVFLQHSLKVTRHCYRLSTS